MLDHLGELPKYAAKKFGDNVGFFPADVTKRSECKKLVKYAINTFGNIDISPIIVFIALEFIKRLIIEYWPG